MGRAHPGEQGQLGQVSEYKTFCIKATWESGPIQNQENEADDSPDQETHEDPADDLQDQDVLDPTIELSKSPDLNEDEQNVTYPVERFSDTEPIQEQPLNQNRKPRKNDKISFFSTSKDQWLSVILTSNEIKRYPYYFNYINNEKEEAGVYLKPGERWTFTPEETDSIPVARSSNASEVPSLKPTPEVSPASETSSGRSRPMTRQSIDCNRIDN